MIKYRQWKKKHPNLHLVMACYAGALLLALLWGTGCFLGNRILYATGFFTETVLEMDDFTPIQLEELENGSWVSVGSDPQLILNEKDLRVDSVRTHFQFIREPVIQTVFYANQDGNYNLRNMVYAYESEKGSVYWLPSGGGQNLRIDPDSSYGNVFYAQEIVVNEPRPAWAFFVPSGMQIGILLLAPAIVAGVLQVLLGTQWFLQWKEHRERGKTP